MVLYFAYGSNMKTQRLKDRVGEVDVIETAELKNHCLTFNKLSNDGSGKANIEPKEGSSVEGVIFSLTEEQIKKLDCLEEGYIRVKTSVVKFDNNTVMVQVYIANPDKIRRGLDPKREYLQYLIDGTEEHNLSNHYKQFLSSFKCTYKR